MSETCLQQSCEQTVYVQNRSSSSPTRFRLFVADLSAAQNVVWNRLWLQDIGVIMKYGPNGLKCSGYMHVTEVTSERRSWHPSQRARFEHRSYDTNDRCVASTVEPSISAQPFVDDPLFSD